MSKDKKYKLNTELTLQEVMALRVLANHNAFGWEVYREVGEILYNEGFTDYPSSIPVGFLYGGMPDFNKSIADIITKHKKSERKTVKIGDKTYYEDELAQALANIKEVK